MKLRFFIAVILITCVSAHARMGETFDQCVARYGNGTYTGDRGGSQHYLFKVNGWEITISFIDNIAEGMIYRKFGEISDHERDNLLQIEGARRKWSRLAGNCWKDDSGDTAMYAIRDFSEWMVFWSAKIGANI